MCPWFDSWRYHIKHKTRSVQNGFFISCHREKLAFLRRRGIKKHRCKRWVFVFAGAGAKGTPSTARYLLAYSVGSEQSSMYSRLAAFVFEGAGAKGTPSTARYLLAYSVGSEQSSMYSRLAAFVFAGAGAKGTPSDSPSEVLAKTGARYILGVENNAFGTGAKGTPSTARYLLAYLVGSEQ